MTRWLVTGAGGLLGSDLTTELGPAAEGRTRAELDVTDPPAVAAAVAGADVVVNCAGWTDVDGAEAHEDAATRVNRDGARTVALACARWGARLVHLSTDYVFDGRATTPYAEDAPVAPRTAYGRSKAAGERAVLEALPSAYVVRTAWLYGAAGRSFVRTMAAAAARGEGVEVVDDQRGQPTWSRELARAVVALAGSGAPGGVYHVSAAGETTWCGLARAVFEELGADPALVAATTSARYVRPASRPAYSVLGSGRWQRAGLAPLPHWRATLGPALAGELAVAWGLPPPGPRLE